jgi:hypothetical protein
MNDYEPSFPNWDPYFVSIATMTITITITISITISITSNEVFDFFVSMTCHNRLVKYIKE